MIARHWKGLVKKDRAADYISHLKNDTFEKLSHINGFVRASILSRNTETGVEFLIITEWNDIEAIKHFAGETYELAVVPKIAREMMVSYDPLVSHYEIYD